MAHLLPDEPALPELDPLEGEVNPGMLIDGKLQPPSELDAGEAGAE